MSRRRTKKIINISSDKEPKVEPKVEQKVENFKYKTKPSDFQESLKEFYIDLPEDEQDKINQIKEDPVESINLSDSKEDEKLSTEELNKNYKSFMKKRNETVSPQHYSKVENKPETTQNNFNDNHVKFFSSTNRNDSVFKGTRATQPTSRVNNKLSENR